MAYTYTQIAAPYATVDLVAGSVIQYNGVLLNVTGTANQFMASTSWILSALGNLNLMTYVDPVFEVAPIDSNTPNSAIYLQSGVPDEEAPPVEETPPAEETPPVLPTLTSKTIAGFTKAAQLIGENRTHIKTAESNITGLQTRVTAAESSIATVDQRIADAETRAKNSAVETILGGATNAQLDSIKELGDALTDLSGDGVGAINAALAKRVSVNAQTWTSNEQAQARTNIGAASGSDVTNAISASVGDPSTIDIDAIFASVGTF